MTPHERRIEEYLERVWSVDTIEGAVLTKQLATVHSWLTSFRNILPEEHVPTVTAIIHAISPDNPILARVYRRG